MGHFCSRYTQQTYERAQMKEYSFPDPDNDGYEIIIPKEVVKDIIINYLKTTYYWSVGIFCIIIGILIGALV